MSKPLLGKLRAKWDALIATEGKRLGLSDCHPFLENKMVNDIFYEGRFNGRPCIVKCSSKAPDSIENEYSLARRVFDCAPATTPEPLAYWRSEDGCMAFIVTARIDGQSLTERLTQSISAREAEAFAGDILVLAAALKNANVVHRDLFADNLLLDTDGHLRVIDFQFAIDRTDYRECDWMRKNWKYRYVIFGVNHDLGLGVWNDMAALVRVLSALPQTDTVRAAIVTLKSQVDESSFKSIPSSCVRIKLWLYSLSLFLQLFLHSRKAAKVARVRLRLHRICDHTKGIDGSDNK